MNFKQFRQRYRDAESTKTVFILMTLGLMVVVILQQIKINSQHERVVVTPPHLTEEAKIAWDSASQNYMNDFALYVVSQISAATPATVDYTAASMEAYFDPKVWAALKPQLLAIKNNPNYVGINPVSNFTPTGGVIYEPSTNKIFVVGRLISSAYSKGGMTQIGAIDATYELKMYINNGLPRVSAWYAYTGTPKTLAWAAKHPAAAQKDAQERAAETRSVPLVADDEIQLPDRSTQNQLSITPDMRGTDSAAQALPGTVDAQGAANAADAAVQGVILPDGTHPPPAASQPAATPPATDLL